ncbi:MAG: hypothetical protein A2X11_15235 [Bacteroidetes bacterium GWE2_42_24]|nr:MAG: hypothetical protein A2X11_15235 [Bacteroidetes bacterium GWE2_42_24]OFY31696.1 MAG: hypothetical protein A2X09_08980 [Bacteroidetes bacterium GWF2_43_11]
MAAQVKGTPENIMSSFIYNFTAYLTWPVEETKAPFKIIVLGSNEFFQPLNYIAGVKMVKGRKIEVKLITKESEIEPCHILVVSEDFQKSLLTLNDNELLHETVIITNCLGCLTKGASINFVSVNEKIHFEINKKALDIKSIKASSQLLKLAVKVI